MRVDYGVLNKKLILQLDSFFVLQIIWEVVEVFSFNSPSNK